MNTHHIDLAEYRAKSRGNGVLYLGTAGSHGNERLEVTLGEDWKGLTVQAIFHPSEVAVQLPAGGLLEVPWEATAKPLTAIQGKIVFQGFNQDRLVNTIDLAYTVAQHSSAVGRDEEPYTPGIVEGVLNQMAADKEEIMSAAQQADQAKIIIQQTLEKVEHAAAEALDHIAAAAPALPAVSAANAGKTVTVNSNGTGYQLSGPFLPAEAGIRPTVSGNPAVCKDSIAWGFQGLKIYGKSIQTEPPTSGNPVSILSGGRGGSIGLDITGTNLLPFPYTDGVLKTSNGITFTVLEDGRISARGTASANAVFSLVGQFGALTNIPDGILSGTPKCSGAEIRYVNEELKTISDMGEGINLSSHEFFTGIGYIECRILTGNTVDCVFAPMLNPGDSALPYEPYTHRHFSISTPEGLQGIPVTTGGNYTDISGKQWNSDVKDFYRKINIQNTIEFVFDGSSDENWELLAETKGNRYRIKLSSACKVSNAETQSSMNSGFILGTPSGTSITPYAYNIESDGYLYLSLSGTESLEALKSFLQSHPMQLLASLVTPTITQISSEELSAYDTLHTYAGITSVSTDESVAGIEACYIMNGTALYNQVAALSGSAAQTKETMHNV